MNVPTLNATLDPNKQYLTKSVVTREPHDKGGPVSDAGRRGRHPRRQKTSTNKKERLLKTLNREIKPVREGPIPDDAPPALVESYAPFNDADPLTDPVKNPYPNTFTTSVSTDIAIDLVTVTVTVC